MIAKLVTVMLVAGVGTAANAQSTPPPDTSQTRIVTAQPTTKKTFEEKAAIASAVLVAGFGAFKAIRAATQASTTPASAPATPVTPK